MRWSPKKLNYLFQSVLLSGSIISCSNSVFPLAFEYVIVKFDAPIQVRLPIFETLLVQTEMEVAVSLFLETCVIRHTYAESHTDWFAHAMYDLTKKKKHFNSILLLFVQWCVFLIRKSRPVLTVNMQHMELQALYGSLQLTIELLICSVSR